MLDCLVSCDSTTCINWLISVFFSPTLIQLHHYNRLNDLPEKLNTCCECACEREQHKVAWEMVLIGTYGAHHLKASCSKRHHTNSLIEILHNLSAGLLQYEMKWALYFCLRRLRSIFHIFFYFYFYFFEFFTLNICRWEDWTADSSLQRTRLSYHLETGSCCGRWYRSSFTTLPLQMAKKKKTPSGQRCWALNV